MDLEEVTQRVQAGLVPSGPIEAALARDGLAVVRLDDLVDLLQASAVAALPDKDTVDDTFSDRIEVAAFRVLEDHATHLEQNSSYYTRREAAMEIRGLEQALRLAIRAAIATPSSNPTPETPEAKDAAHESPFPRATAVQGIS